MTSTMPSVSKYRSYNGFLCCILVLFLDVTNSEQLSSFVFYQREDTTTSGLAQSTTVTMETATHTRCAINCALSSGCTGFVWDSVSTSCTIGNFVNSSDVVLPSGSTLYAIQEHKCRFDLGYEMRSYNDVIRCLHVSDGKLNYEQAGQNCHGNGGRLYKANSVDLIKLALQMIDDRGLSGENAFWVGLDDIKSEDNFVWSDGQVLTQEERKEIFLGNEPNNHGDEDCAIILISRGGLLNDAPCYQAKHYICELVI